jgi:hypothetical protein
MINFLLRKKIAKNEKQATIILGSVIIAFLALSTFIIKNSLSNDEELIIINKYGQEIPFDQYVDMLNRGVEPII